MDFGLSPPSRYYGISYEHLYTSFCVDMSLVLLGMNLGVELLGPVVSSVFNLLRNCWNVFQCTISVNNFAFLVGYTL